jgi:hypothetical protein
MKPVRLNSKRVDAIVELMGNSTEETTARTRKPAKS